MDGIKKGTGIQSLQIGLSIVELVASQGRPMTFTDICEMTQITKSNLYKYLNTLTNMGILYRDKFGGLYTLGNKLIEYGMAAVSQENVLERVEPYLYEINRECKETVLLSFWTPNGPIVVKLLTSNHILNIGAQIGTYLPIYSATGKVYAAFKNCVQIHEWKEKELQEIPGEQRQDLEKELDRIKKERISFAIEPLVPSVSSVAVPILNFKQELLCVITLVGFSDSLDFQVDNEKIKYLLDSSQEISSIFGSTNVNKE
ncbi:IclR family transcriptional regulator [Fodinisporobacter ferrooxydans]|uniref:IclR family transcriptional regulator n=1 Tax=Fodinisporobacter ferrooxydans TaxID=2901836 RepID=A0ABY4CFI5_9BACL|nr:IclR family transcriptional regulator [Alicyclobacillaceae bacterium MYW30-H2]